MSIGSKILIALGILLLTAASLRADGIQFNAVTDGVYGGISAGKFVGSNPVPCVGGNFSLKYNNSCNTVYYMTIH